MFSENTSRDGLSVLLIEDNPGDRRLTEIAQGQGASIHDLSAEDRAIVQAAGEAVWEPALAELGDGARAYLDTMLRIREQCPAG